MAAMRPSARVFLETRRSERKPGKTGFMPPGLPQQVASALANAQVLHLAPDAYGDPVLTPESKDWDEIVKVLGAAVDGPVVHTSENSLCSTSSGGTGFALMAPFDRSDRMLPEGQGRKLDQVYRPAEVYVVHHGWVTRQRRGENRSFEWWKDPDRSVETHLLGLARANGFESALRRRRVIDRHGEVRLPRLRPNAH